MLKFYFILPAQSAVREGPHCAHDDDIMSPTTQSRDEEASQKLGLDPSATPDAANKNGIELQSTSSGQPADPATDTDGPVGVQRIEATTQVWTKPWLYTAYLL